MHDPHNFFCLNTHLNLPLISGSSKACFIFRPLHSIMNENIMKFTYAIDPAIKENPERHECYAQQSRRKDTCHHALFLAI